MFIGDSHSAGADFSRILYGAMDGSKSAYYAVCGANAAWFLSSAQNRRGRMPCHAVSRPGEGAPRISSGTVPALPDFEQMLAEKPDNVVIALGSNMDGGNGAGVIRTIAEKLALLNPKPRCVWIGPPGIPASQASYRIAFYEQLRAQLAGNGVCRVVDSAAMMDGVPAGDRAGIHYAPQHSRVWAEGVLRELSDGR